MSKATPEQQAEQQAQYLRTDALRLAMQYHSNTNHDGTPETIVQTANSFYNFIKGNDK